MTRLIGLLAAIFFVAGAVRADTPPAPAAQDQAAPPAPTAPPAAPPANPPAVPAPEHKDGPCGLAAIHKDLVSAEKAIRASAPYKHAAGHDRQAIALINHAMKELNHGCAAYKHSLKKQAPNAAAKK